MWPDRVSNGGPLTYESGALPTALRGPASDFVKPCESTIFPPLCQRFPQKILQNVRHTLIFIDEKTFYKSSSPFLHLLKFILKQYTLEVQN